MSESMSYTIVRFVGLLTFLALPGLSFAQGNGQEGSGDQQELKKSADAAAIAGVTALTGRVSECSGTGLSSEFFCTGRKRWELASTYAFRRARTDLFSSRKEQLDVTVERGRMLGGRFQSLEEPFGVDNPGIPVFLAANAVRVSIRRQVNVTPGAGPSFGTLVSSVASIAPRDTVDIAPLAVHACSLVNRNPFEPYEGEYDTPDFHPYMSCLADRLFTSTDRYCPEGDEDADCGVLPAFQWDPIPAFRTIPPMRHNEFYWQTILTPRGASRSVPGRNPGNLTQGTNPIPPNFLWDRACFWPTPRYLEYGDNFGVFGVVGKSIEGIDEGVIEDAFRGDVRARIGHRFLAYGPGVTSEAGARAIWSRIIAVSPDPADTHLPFGPSGSNVPNASLGYVHQSGRSVPNVNDHLGFGSLHPVCSGGTPTRWFPSFSNSVPSSTRLFSSPPGGPASIPATRFVWEPANQLAGEPVPTSISLGGGTCNSIRSGWGYWQGSERQENFPSNTCFGSGYFPPGVARTSTTFSSHFGSLPVWRAVVPVVAEPGRDARACAGLPGNLNGPDPKIEPFVPYEIIGFVAVDLFDLDIGRDSPQPPSEALVSGSPQGCANPYYRSQSPISPSQGGIQNQQNLGFRYIRRRVNGAIEEAQQCNLVRGRIPCYLKQFPSSFDPAAQGEPGAPYLVN